MKPRSKEKLVNKVPILIIQRKFTREKVKCRSANPVIIHARAQQKFQVRNPGKSSSSQRQSIPKSRKDQMKMRRVPLHILRMNKFPVLAYRPFTHDPPRDMTVLRFHRPHSVPTPGPRRILFHVPRLPGVFVGVFSPLLVMGQQLAPKHVRWPTHLINIQWVTSRGRLQVKTRLSSPKHILVRHTQSGQ